jgi:hypothetical protein
LEIRPRDDDALPRPFSATAAFTRRWKRDCKRNAAISLVEQLALDRTLCQSERGLEAFGFRPRHTNPHAFADSRAGRGERRIRVAGAECAERGA